MRWSTVRTTVSTHPTLLLFLYLSLDVTASSHKLFSVLLVVGWVVGCTAIIYFVFIFAWVHNFVLLIWICDWIWLKRWNLSAHTVSQAKTNVGWFYRNSTCPLYNHHHLFLAFVFPQSLPFPVTLLWRVSSPTALHLTSAITLTLYCWKPPEISSMKTQSLSHTDTHQSTLPPCRFFQ